MVNSVLSPSFTNRSFKSWFGVAPQIMGEFLNPFSKAVQQCWVMTWDSGFCHSKANNGQESWSTGMQKKASFKSSTNTRGCLRVYCSVQCHLWPLSLVLYEEQQGWRSPYSWNFWIFGHIPSRVSFYKGYCLLLGVPSSRLKPTLTGAARLALPGLPTAHTMGLTWFSISSS